VLEVANLSVGRGGISLLNNVSFSLKAGQGLVLRGPNGIGKTSLLRSVAGLQRPLCGDISLDGSIAYAAHVDGNKGQLTVRENLNFWADVYGSEMMEVALIAFKLHDLGQRPAANLSAGQQRRLSLARMLVTGCKVWVMDEPTVSLDQENIALFRVAVERHLQLGGIALLSSHSELELNIETLDLVQFRASQRIIVSAFDKALE
jgi:heme exporter protein A